MPTLLLLFLLLLLLLLLLLVVRVFMRGRLKMPNAVLCKGSFDLTMETYLALRFYLFLSLVVLLFVAVMSLSLKSACGR